MLQLICPQCESDLEIDDAFCGGVCRCFQCGTLLTVPDDPGRDIPETLSRPSAPGEAPADDEGGIYTTDTGRTVEMTSRQMARIPVAQKKRMGVRITTVAVVMLIFASLLGGIIYAGVHLFNSGRKPDLTPAQIAALTYDLRENPFLLKGRPHFFSIPLAERTAIMIDSSRAMSPYLDVLKKAITLNLETAKPDQQIQIILWRESAPVVHPPKPEAAGKIKPQELSDKLDGILANGALSPEPAFAAASASQPKLIVLVAHLMPEAADLRVIAGRIQNMKAKLVVIHLDAEQPHAGMQRTAEESGGRYLKLSGGQLQRWYDKYVNQ